MSALSSVFAVLLAVFGIGILMLAIMVIGYAMAIMVNMIIGEFKYRK